MDTEVQRRASLSYIGAGLITMAVVGAAFAAFDDITTDNDTSFTFEYAGLVVCAGWLMLVGVGLVRREQRILGGISLLALVAAIWGQRAIGPGTIPGATLHYVAVVGAFGWFAVLSVILLVMGWLMHSERRAQAARYS